MRQSAPPSLQTKDKFKMGACDNSHSQAEEGLSEDHYGEAAMFDSSAPSLFGDQ